MVMKRTLGLGAWAVCLGAIVAGCTGGQGLPGKDGTNGTNGTNGMNGTTLAPSVSAVTPPYAFLGRTVDLTIAGNGTNWSSATTVAFGDTNIKVNKVTAASATGLLVNVTVGAGAAIAATDVTITDGSNMEVYKGAFQVKEPLAVTVDPTTGLAQGGLANIHVQMFDVTTPFDATTATVTLSNMTSVAMSQPQFTDFGIDFSVEADVLAQTGAVDLVVASDGVSSPAKGAFQLTARTPTTLTAGTAATSTINTEIDTGLFQFTPASASQEFVQFTLATTTSDAQVSGTVIPKSGAYADALSSGFGFRYGQGVTSTDLFYAVVGDASGFAGPGPTPADYTVTVFEAACTAATETAETSGSNNDTTSGAQPISTLPVLVSGTLGYGTVTPDTDVDTYMITVPSGKTTIHAATGGDPLDDTVIQILDSSGNMLAASDDLDYQEDLVYSSATAGTYYVQVSASMSGAFSDTDNTYQLFIAVN
jgi:Bacterial pre-peptidase C-terminal domain